MIYARISGIASYVPEDILDNDMLSKMVDTNDEWITTRVGIKQRRILKQEGAGSSFLGAKAVEKLLASTGTAPEEVELLICATSNPDYRFPSTGSVIAHECGLKNSYAYDIQAACAGFIVALEDAAAYVRSGLRKKVVVVAAEKCHQWSTMPTAAHVPCLATEPQPCSLNLQKSAQALLTLCSMSTAKVATTCSCAPVARFFPHRTKL